MKKFLVLSILSAGMSLSAFASDREMSKLTNFVLDGAPMADTAGVRGSIVVDHSEKTVSLSVLQQPVCLPGAVCPRFLRLIDQVSDLPIVSVSRGACNQTITVAFKDYRLVDGNYEKIQIVDNSTNTCRYVIAPPAVSVIHTTITSGMSGTVGRSRNQYIGDAFEPLATEF